jgi:hypothetical protein
MARINPEMALNRIIKMRDAKSKLLLTRAIAAEWAKHQPSQAKVWLQKSELAERRKSRSSKALR